MLPPPPRRRTWWALAVIAGATLAAYAGSLRGPMVFDDAPSIRDNATIRHLWPPWPTLCPPSGRGLTVEGRPLLNYSFAVNYALGGASVWSYHAVNLAIHLLAACLLYGVVRRTLPRAGWAQSPERPALAIAVLWAVHPLQTEAVTYIVQRAESLMSLCYLLTLYGLVRANVGSPRNESPADSAVHRTGCGPASAARVGDPGRGWLWLSVGACAVGMATKEVMASAPLMVLLYDRTFVAGSFRGAWRRRRLYYLALALTWIPLALLLWRAGASRSGTAGLGTSMSCWRYAATQCVAAVHYIRLVFWPHPLVFDYGVFLASNPAQIAACAGVVALLLALTAAAVIRKRPEGFCGAWFFGILAPSSSFLPVATQTIAEHRMYLPSAAVIALSVAFLFTLRARRAAAVCALAAAAAALTTAARNRDYRTDLALYRSNVAARPQNPRAHYNLGTVLYRRRDVPAAIAEFHAALRLDPAYADAHNNLGNALLHLGQTDAAIAQYRAALQSDPRHVAAHYDLGNALTELGRPQAAAAEYTIAERLRPDAAEPKAGLAGVLVLEGRLPEAIRECRDALRLDPDDAEAHFVLANAWDAAGEAERALPEYAAALRLQLDEAKVHYNYANALAETNRLRQSEDEYRAALRLRPNDARIHFNLGNLLARQRRLGEAIAEFREAVRLTPEDAAAHNNLGSALLESGRLDEAAREFAAALRLDPRSPSAKRNAARLRDLQAAARN